MPSLTATPAKKRIALVDKRFDHVKTPCGLHFGSKKSLGEEMLFTVVYLIRDKPGMRAYPSIRVVKSKQWRYLDRLSSVRTIVEHRATNSTIQYYNPGNSKVPPSAGTTQ
uniref:Uncharacterized protein n=1 Tax=Vespula pensylvanica TaxID=30213 RepID=A0A834JFS0_VESPE|nr:hypothetical protein H0235_018286 [Vespula pensylvanica]